MNDAMRHVGPISIRFDPLENLRMDRDPALPLRLFMVTETLWLYFWSLVATDAS